MKRIVLTLMACFALFTINAQVNVELVTPEEAVDLLTGGGVEPFNISFTGDPDQLGFMTGAEDTDYPIGQGIILSTEAAAAFACTSGGAVSGVSGEPDLLNIANSVPPLIGQGFSVSSVNDVCILEFDFVAAGNEVSFNYSFGSDEYLEWVNSSFNDVFAFFLSGPGIIGEYDSPPGFPNGAINLAIVPESDPELPITISSVNTTLNSDYYINNPSNIGVCSDGFTVNLTVSNTVLCGETYHIKLAIADGSDTALESIVILEAGSFDSNGVFITADPSIEGSFEFANDTVLVEGCNEGFFTLFRADSEFEEEVFFEVTGSATSVSDYPAFPPSVTFLAGEFAAEVPVLAFEDGIAEDPENITLSYTFVNTCGDSVTSSASLWIVDHTPPSLATEDVILYCGTQYITADVLSGYAPFAWEWGIVGGGVVSTSPGILVSTGNEYYVTATDPCGLSDSTTVSVIDTDDPPPPIELAEDTFNVPCPGDFLTIEPVFTGGAPDFFYLWSGPGVGGYSEPTYTTNFTENVTYTITIADQCGQIESFDIDVIVPEYVPIVIEAEDGLSNCPGADVILTATADNGFAPYEYFWGLDGEGQTITVNPDQTTTYEVQVQDACNYVGSAFVTVVMGDPEQITIEDFEPECLNLGQPIVITGGSAPYSFTFDENLIDVDNSVITGLAIGTWDLTISDACGSIEDFPLTVIGCETVVPNIFTPGNGDDFNDVLYIFGLDAFPKSKLTVFNRWGTVVYEEADYLNDWDGGELADGTYYYVLERADGVEQSGYVQIVRKK